MVTVLFEFCLKNETTNNIKGKGMRIVESYSRENFVYVFYDGSLDETLENRQVGTNLNFLKGGGKQF